MAGAVHTFSNGVRVYDRQLIDLQRARYRRHNVHEIEEEGLFLQALDRLERGATYVNLGAGIGYYPILASLRRPDLHVVAYEPLRRHRRHIRSNLRLNGLRGDAVSIHAEGVDDEAGWRCFRPDDFSSNITAAAAGQRLPGRWYGYLVNRLIRTTTLTALAAGLGGAIGLLQMDIQGREAPVLQSSAALLRSGRIAQVLVGTHSTELHRQVLEVLGRSGYRIRREIGTPRQQPDGIVWAVCGGAWAGGRR